MAASLVAGAQTTARKPSAPDLNFLLGTQAMQREDWPAAIRHLRQADPHDAEVLFYLAQAYYMAREWTPALSTIAEAARLAPSNAQIIQKHGQFLCDRDVHCPDGLAELKRARALDPHLEEIDFNLGVANYRTGNIPAARSSLEAELRRNPGHAEAHFYLAEVLARLAESSAEWQKVKLQYEAAIRTGGERGPYYYGAGRAMIALDELDASVAAFKKALELEPGLTESHFQLGKALRRLGREGEGRRELELFRASRDLEKAPSALVRVEGAEGERTWRELKSLAEAGDERALLARLEQMSGGANAWLKLGAVYCTLSKPDLAIGALERSIREQPENADAKAWLGRAFLLKHNATAAESHFQAALNLDARNQTALAGLGEIRFSQQRWNEAARSFESSQSKQSEVLVMLCEAYVRLNDMENARLAAELVRIFAPEDRQAHAAIERILHSH